VGTKAVGRHGALLRNLLSRHTNTGWWRLQILIGNAGNSHGSKLRLNLSPKAVSIGLVGLALIGFLGLMVWGITNKTLITGQSGFTRVQEPAPDFRLQLFNGGELTLYQHRGQPVVINFWASWCPPCRAEATALERTWRAYKDKEVLFVGVNIQDSEEDARTYLREFDVTYPNGPDTNGKATVNYGGIGIPVTFFVNRAGIIERRWVGAVNERQLVAWIDELVAGIAPSGEVEVENLEDFFRLDQQEKR